MLNVCLFINFSYINFSNIEFNLGHNNNTSKCRVLYHNIRGLCNNVIDLHIASRKYDIILCPESLVSSRRQCFRGASVWFQ